MKLIGKIEPVASPNPKNASRWVHEKSDDNFVVAIKPDEVPQ